MTVLLYVAGVGFSGTTLLSFLANAHPEIGSIGELTGPQPDAPETYPCSCGEPVRACPFWAQVKAHMEAAGMSFDPLAWDSRFDLGSSRWLRHVLVRSLRNRFVDRSRDRAVLWVPSYRRRLGELGARNRALVGAISAARGRRVLLDASKHPIRAHFLARAGFDVRVVHFVRDPCGFVASCKKNLSMPVESAIRVWKRGNLQALALSRDFPSMLLRYEDFCGDTQGAIGALAARAGLRSSFSPLPLDRLHVIGNSMRLGFSGVIRIDESWKSSLSPAEIRRVRAATRSLAERLGYDAAASASR